MQSFKRPLYLLAGYLALVVGAIGVVLPLLPTTPFIILAAFFFSRGSERMHQWLLRQKSFGPMIRGWEKYKVIPLKVKIFSTLMMLTMVSYPLLFRPFALWLKVIVVFVIFYGMWFVWRYRSEPLEFAVARFNQARSETSNIQAADQKSNPASLTQAATEEQNQTDRDSYFPESPRLDKKKLTDSETLSGPHPVRIQLFPG
ncbi:YbaN family protein [Oceanospirillum sediminis]|uniref:YbaN family protein n=1 Tax=Oceanospirillum sediminis TaxID=2760088 RepID=A0A839ISE2_9GAMM|nr:YbaN family protein [Oceanospirillum sediminis]MBB1487898.1 YbaN family protein [Oceanospirillum sediminis]